MRRSNTSNTRYPIPVCRSQFIFIFLFLIYIFSLCSIGVLLGLISVNKIRINTVYPVFSWLIYLRYFSISDLLCQNMWIMSTFGFPVRGRLSYFPTSLVDTCAVLLLPSCGGCLH